jgi:hypothetical protein
MAADDLMAVRYSLALQGREEYAEYFSEDFVAQQADLAWGVDGK